MSEEEILCSASPVEATFNENIQQTQHCCLEKCDIVVPSGRLPVRIEHLTLFFPSPPQTLVPPSTPPPPAAFAPTGAALPTGSSALAWVACIQPSILRSTFSTTYLKARASVSASSTPMPTAAAGTSRAAPEPTATEAAAAAAAACSRFAVKSATASC